MIKRKKKKNNLNKEEDSFINSVFWLIGWMILLALVLGGVFKSFDKSNELNIANAFEFAGSFGGAVLGAGASFIILSITSIRQKRDLEDQRKIDNDKWEITNLQIRKELEINSINDKISDYKSCANEIQKFANECFELANKFTEYLYIILSFQKELKKYEEYIFQSDNKNESKNKIDEMKANNKKTNLDIFNVDSLIVRYNTIIELQEKTDIACTCIMEEKIKSCIENVFEKLLSTKENIDFFIALDLGYSNKKEYYQYFINDKETYGKIMEKSKERNNNISNIQNKFVASGSELEKITGMIKEAIAMLYKNKYNLYKNDIES